MDLLPDEQQGALAQAARALIEGSNQTERLRTLDTDRPVTDAGLWAAAARQGFFALDMPESHGGTDLGLAEQSLVFRELGRAVVPGPFLGTVLAAHVALAGGAPELAKEIAAGDQPVGFLERTSDGLLSTLDAGEATTWVLAEGAESAVYDAAAVTMATRKTSTDPGSRLATMRLSGSPAATVTAATFDAVAYGAVLVAALLAGIAESTRDMSAAYTTTRQQFGAPIGSFQAVKHRCADMAVRAEAATQLVSLAALAVGERRQDASLLWPSARSVAADYAMRNASDNIQNHGAIGFTAEHTAHLFLKRAHALNVLHLDPPELREAVLSAPAVRP